MTKPQVELGRGVVSKQGRDAGRAMLIVGIVRMAKKMDGIILRIGLNPALTGDPLGTHFPGMLTAMTLRSIAQMVTRTAAQGMPSTGHGSPAPPASGSFMQHSGKQGSQSAGTAGAASARRANRTDTGVCRWHACLRLSGNTAGDTGRRICFVLCRLVPISTGMYNKDLSPAVLHTALMPSVVRRLSRFRGRCSLGCGRRTGHPHRA